MNDWKRLIPLVYTANKSSNQPPSESLLVISPEIGPRSSDFRGQMWTARTAATLGVCLSHTGVLPGSDGQELLEASVPCHQYHVHLEQA